MVNKSRIQVSMDPDVLRKMDRKTDNRSQKFQELARKWLDMEEAKDEELVRERNKVEEKLEKLEKKKQEIEEEMDGLETELKSIEFALEKQEEEESIIEEAVQALVPEVEECRSKLSPQDRKNNPEKAFDKLVISEKFNLWLDKVDASEEELLEAVKEEVQEL